jgi:ABC-type transport system involved in cytochrome c biogenesis ATPase subunit
MPLLQFLAGLLSGKAGETIGNTVSTAAQIAAVMAAIAPVGLWLAGHKDEVFITLTYGELAFWSALIGGQLLLVIRLVHRAPPP